MALVLSFAYEVWLSANLVINYMQQHCEAKQYTLTIIDTITIDVLFRDPILFQFWEAGNLTDLLNGKFQIINVRLTKGESVRIQSKNRLNDICIVLEEALCNIRCIKVDLKLVDPDIQTAFRQSPLISNILDQYFVGRYVVKEWMKGATKGSLLLYFNVSYTSEVLALKKSYELSGLTHQNLTFVTKDVVNLQDMKLSEKIPLLEIVVQQYFDYLKKWLSGEIEDFTFQSMNVDRNGDLVLNVIGFRKSFIILHQKLFDWLSHLVFKVIPVGSEPYPGRNANLQELVNEINQREEVIRKLEGVSILKYHIRNSFIFLVGDADFNKNLQMFIQSHPRKIKYSEQEIEFLRREKADAIKELKRNTDYFELKLESDHMQVLSNFENFQKIKNSIDTFLRSRMLETCYHRFKSHQNLLIFMKYYPDLQNKLANLKMCTDDKYKIEFQCHCNDKNFLVNRLEECQRNIVADTKRLFVPNHIESKALTVQHYEHGYVYSPLCQEGFQIRNRQNARIHLIDDYRLLTTPIYSLLLPFKAFRQKSYFLSTLSEQLMELNGYLSIFMKLTIKDHKKRIGFTYCNDKSNNINEMLCCNIQPDVKILVDEMNSTIMNNLNQDGIGIVIPDDDIDCMKKVLNAFISVIEDYCGQESKGMMFNFYAVCSNFNMMAECQDFIVNEMNYGLKLLPAQLSIFSAYELKLMPFYSLEMEKGIFQSNLLAYIVALEDICWPKTDAYPGLIVNLVKADGKPYDLVLINYDQKRVYDFKEGSSHGIRDYLRKRQSEDIQRYLRINLEVSKMKKAGPKLHIMHLRDGQLVGQFYRIKRQGFVKTMRQDTSFHEEDIVIPYKVKKTKKLSCFVLSGYDREILSVVNCL